MPRFTLIAARTLVAAATIGALAVAAPASVAATAKTKSEATAQVTAGHGQQGKKRGRPDLSVRDLKVTAALTGFQINARVVNLGRRTAQQNTVAMALSADDTFDPGDQVLTTVRFGKTHRGVAKLLDVVVPFPDDALASTDGRLYLLVCADPDGVINERREGNNCKSVLVQTSQEATGDPIVDGSTYPASVGGDDEDEGPSAADDSGDDA
jgi:hypothetical protein